MEREVERLFGDGWPTEARGVQALPRLDVKETDKALVVTAELPGVDEKDVEAELTGRTLVLRGEKKQETDTDEKGYHLMERTYGSFLRSLQLPDEADAAKVEGVFCQRRVDGYCAETGQLSLVRCARSLSSRLKAATRDSGAPQSSSSALSSSASMSASVKPKWWPISWIRTCWTMWARVLPLSHHSSKIGRR